MYYIQKQSGFTLVELITVIFVVGLLSVVAIPRFINVQDKAEIAALEGVVGGFASGVALVRAQWEVLGQPGGDAVKIPYGSTLIGVDEGFGYPTSGGGASDTGADTMDVEKCKKIFETVLHNGPSVTTSWEQNDLRNSKFYVSFDSFGSICTYSSTRSIREITYFSETNLIDAAKQVPRIAYASENGDVKLLLETASGDD